MWDVFETECRRGGARSRHKHELQVVPLAPLPSAKSGHVWSSLVLLKGPCRSTHGAKARCTSLTVVAKLLRCKLDTPSTGA